MSISLGSKVMNQLLILLCPGLGYNSLRGELITKLVSKITDDNVNKKKVNVSGEYTPMDASSNMSSFKCMCSEKLDSVVSTLCKWNNISKERSVDYKADV